MQFSLPRHALNTVPRAWGGLDIARIVTILRSHGLTLALLALTIAACVIRAGSSPQTQGTMGRDETRLAMAARAILEHGYPLLPGGLVYTRGLLPAYLEAGAFGLLGFSDPVARLPSLIAGILLVLAVFAFARDILGRWPAVAVATIIAFSPPLAFRSQEAWFYEEFVLWFVLALYFLYRSYQQPRMETRLLSALAFTAGMFTHEFTVLVVPIALVADVAARWRSNTPPSIRQLIVFWSLICSVTGVIFFISLALRASTVSGSMSEIKSYVQPHLDVRTVITTGRMLQGWHTWLLPAAALGLLAPLIPAARSRRAGLLYVTLTLAVCLAFVDLVLGRSGHERDHLILLPFLVILGVAGAQFTMPWVLRFLTGNLLKSGPWLSVAMIVIFVIATARPQRSWAEAREPGFSSTWFQNMSDFDADDLVMTYAPTIGSYYLGHTDFWLRSTGYAKYVWAGRPPYHDIHSNAALIRGKDELNTLVLKPNAGRIMWIVWRPSESTDADSSVNEILASLEGRTVSKRKSPDGNVVLKVQL